MQYVTPLIENLNALLYGGGNSCRLGSGDKNVCTGNGTGNAGCYALGGPGHTCTADGSGNAFNNNGCAPGMG